MRPQNPATSKKMTGKTGNPVFNSPSFSPVMADSLEVMEVYYRERIQSFNEMLDQLNILQDAPEIEFLCREIIEARATLAKIAVKKKYSA
jgi:hypothetical protein